MDMPTVTALRRLRAALSELEKVDLAALELASDRERLQFTELAIAVEAQAVGIKMAGLAAVENARSTEAVHAMGTASWLRSEVNSTHRQARADVIRATATARCARIADAVREGNMTEAHRKVAIDAIGVIDGGATPVSSAQRSMIEEALVLLAQEYTPPVYARHVTALVEKIAGQTFQEREELAAKRSLQAENNRYLRFTQSFDGYSTYLQGALPTEAFEKILPVLMARAGRLRQDNRHSKSIPTAGQRLADALVEALTADQMCGQSPQIGGDRPRVVLTGDFRKLLGEVGPLLGGAPARSADVQVDAPSSDRRIFSGRPDGSLTDDEVRASARVLLEDLKVTYSEQWHRHTETGTRVSALAFRFLACDPEVMFCDLDSTGLPRGTTPVKRLVGGRLRRELALRDRGCVFPGCETPASECEAHHVLSWLAGGLTTPDNLVLVCPHHHRTVQHDPGDSRHWTIRVRPDGVPEAIPPAAVDPLQRPIVHDRHRLYRRPQPPADLVAMSLKPAG